MYSEKYDFELYQGIPEKIICVYFVPRSGSTFLADKMRETGKLGYPLEYFSALNMAKLRERMPGISVKEIGQLLSCRTSPNGVFSFKWNSNYGPNVILEPDYSIFIDRRDVFAQAASFVTASKSGTWIGNEPGKYTATMKEINQTVPILDNARQNTLNMIKGEYQAIYYEDLMEDEGAVVAGILSSVFGEETTKMNENSDFDEKSTIKVSEDAEETIGDNED